jgi:predicted RND superfamily exporter protein
VAGTPFVWADVIVAIKRDGPRAMLAALLGVALFTGLVLGVGRHGRVTLLAAACGTLGMLAACDLVGVRINFLDFVAFPITLGIAVDYAANVTARARLEGRGARRVVETTGGAVVLCSFTTMAGYGSLLLSPNAGIRSFGLTAILGEITCIVAAVILAPALLEVGP